MGRVVRIGEQIEVDLGYLGLLENVSGVVFVQLCLPCEVQRGDLEDLQCDPRAGLVPGSEGGAGGDASAGGLAADYEPITVDPELVCVLRNPQKCRIAVVVTDGKGVLRGKAVADGNDDDVAADASFTTRDVEEGA